MVGDIVSATSAGKSFYFARSIHFRLGTFLLIRELLNEAGSRIPVHVGDPVPYSGLSGIADPGALSEHLRSVTYELLPAHPPGRPSNARRASRTE